MALKNYYLILGIPEKASLPEIRTAYRRLALRYHPDRNRGGSESGHRFREIKEAYEVLKDPVKKGYYDAELRQERKRSFYAPSYEFGKFSTPATEKIPHPGTERNQTVPAKTSLWYYLKPVVFLLIAAMLLYLIMTQPWR